jgi:hypothetical protein
LLEFRIGDRSIAVGVQGQQGLYVAQGEGQMDGPAPVARVQLGDAQARTVGQGVGATAESQGPGRKKQ